MLIIPAIDIIEGKCVRLSKGDYTTKKVYNENPLEVAKAFQDAGITHLHVVDLDGAKGATIMNRKTLEIITSKTNLIVDFGGGIKSQKDVEIAFMSGATQVTIGSLAIQKPDLFMTWVNSYGPDKLILGADARFGKVSSNGWLQDSTLNVTDFVKKYAAKGVEYCISTDIEKDGMLEGPSFKLYEKLQDQNPGLKVIASGGISSLADLKALKSRGLYGAILGKAIYENRISLKELKTV